MLMSYIYVYGMCDVKLFSYYGFIADTYMYIYTCNYAFHSVQIFANVHSTINLLKMSFCSNDEN